MVRINFASKPASANRSLPVLSVILFQAEACTKYRPAWSAHSTCKDIKRYRGRDAEERFLSPDEIRRVVEVLNRYDVGEHRCKRHVIRLTVT